MHHSGIQCNIASGDLMEYNTVVMQKFLKQYAALITECLPTLVSQVYGDLLQKRVRNNTYLDRTSFRVLWGLQP